MTQINSAQPLEVARLKRPFVAQATKGDFIQGKQYVINQYTIYNGRASCDLCSRNKQATTQVEIDGPRGPVHIGLDCLEMISGITRSDLNREVKDQVEIAKRTRRVANRVLGVQVQNFNNMQEVFQSITNQVNTLGVHKRQADDLCDEVDKFAQSYRTTDLNTNDYERLETILDFISYMSRCKENTNMHLRYVACIAEDPYQNNRTLQAQIRQLTTKPTAQLTPEDVQMLKRAAAKLRQHGLPSIKLQQVPPWEHDDEASYRAALKDHFDRLAQAQEEVNSVLQKQHDFTIKHGRLKTGQMLSMINEMVTLKRQCVTAILASHIKPEDLESTMAQRTLSQDMKAIEVSYIPTLQVSKVNNTPPARRTTSKNGAPSIKDEINIECWYLAAWTPDSWIPVYKYWKQAGSRDKALSWPDN